MIYNTVNQTSRSLVWPPLRRGFFFRWD